MQTTLDISEALQDIGALALFALFSLVLAKQWKHRHWYGMQAVATWGIFAFVAIYVLDHT